MGNHSVIHMIKYAEKGVITAKCGVVFQQTPYGQGDGPHGTMFQSRVTCQDKCWMDLPALQEPSPDDYPRGSKRKADRRDTEMAREPKAVDFPAELMDQIVALRDDEGYKWDQIAEAVGEATGKCMLIYNFKKLPKNQRIKGATADDIVRLRDEESLSWGDIVVRVGYPESSVRSMYSEATGRATQGLRIGKGGRHPKSGATEAPTGPGKAKAATKKAAAKKSGASSTGEQPLAGLDKAGLTDLIVKKAIKVHTDDGEEIIKVSAVKKVTATTIVVADETGAGRTVKRDAVFAVSKRNVLA